MATRPVAGQPTRQPVQCCRAGWVVHRSQQAYHVAQRHAQRCRTAAGDWVPPEDNGSSSGSAGSTAGRLPLLEDAALVQASHELQELCRMQLQLLTATLKLSLQAVLSSSIAGSVSDSIDEEMPRQQLLLETSCLRASVYCRAPGSLQTGQLQLQLVAASDGDGGGAAAAQQQPAQRFLFLGQDGEGGSGGGAAGRPGSLQAQEQWILEQPVIVLPDSGGLVLPLAHNSFLVGLLVVERCLQGEEGAAAAAAPAQAAGAGAAGEAAPAGGGGGGGSGAAAAGMPQPPACLLFRSAEVKLLKQTAAVLALACAMDMRAALERVGAAYRQRQASALVQAAKRPLSMIRTMGTMLLPRLQPGEPDRDFAQGILEQGSRLQEVVSQLQAALHPAAGPAAMPPALRAGSNGARLRQALPGASGSGSSSGGGSQRQLAQPPVGRPALPSSSIGSDYQSGATIDVEEQPAEAAQQQEQPQPGSSSSNSSSAGGSNDSSGSSAGSLVPSSSGGGSRASADLLNVLMPLLASASNFAAVNGVSFVMGEHPGGPAQPGKQPPSGSAQVLLPAAEVAVGPGTLKRLLSQLIDGVIACAARGDLVQASVLPQHWQGKPGVAITLCCSFGLAHGGSSSNSGGGGGGGSRASAQLPRPPLQPEFAFLQSTASNAGGWFESRTDGTPDVAHLNTSALTATLWLPTVTRNAGWPEQ